MKANYETASDILQLLLKERHVYKVQRDFDTVLQPLGWTYDTLNEETEARFKARQAKRAAAWD